jgi:hypothetical protein
MTHIWHNKALLKDPWPSLGHQDALYEHEFLIITFYNVVYLTIAKVEQKIGS